VDVPTTRNDHGVREIVSRLDVGRRTVLSVGGEIDIATAPALTTAIDQALDTGASELWIDLSDTEFMDSAGIHALFEGERLARRLNRSFVIICPHGPVRRVLEITGLVAHFDVYDSREAAHRAA
jgi:anti-sigma B factor antagonist